MAQVQVRDRVIWIRHIHGEPALVKKLESVPAGLTVRLRVAGMSGVWEKMRDRPSGDPTPGFRPIGDVAQFWRDLFEKRRGQLVDLAVESKSESSLLQRSQEERRAAMEALLEMSNLEWRSEEPYGPREELYER